MKKTIILLCGFTIAGCMLGSDGESDRSAVSGERSKEVLEIRLLAAQVAKAEAEAEKAKAEAREAEARARKAEEESTKAEAAKKPAQIQTRPGAPQRRFARNVQEAPKEPDPMALSQALAYGRGWH